MDTLHAFHMLIDGALVDGDSQFGVVDPATEQVFAQAPDCSRIQLDQAVASARRAFPAWRALDLEQRRALLEQLAPKIEAVRDELARLLTREQGKPLLSAQRELESLVRFMRGQCKLTFVKEVVNEDGPERRSITRRVPIGVVAALAPWNFPVLLAWWKVIPALLVGNTVVLKPSPLTPLTALRIAELLADALPPGVINVVSGGDDLGPWLSTHTGIDKVSFTGSTETGRRLMAGAAPTLKRLTLELGGNDAAIVLPDVDVEQLIPSLFWGAFTNSGQVCVAAKRLYVHRSCYDAVRDGLMAYAKSVVVGNGLDSLSQLGPIQNERQYHRVLDLIEDARCAGLNICFQGDIPQRPGYFVPVTLIDNPPDDARVVTEEAFGPVLPLLRYDTIDEVVERVNDSPFGLASSIWGRDEALAIHIAELINCGTVWINESMYLSPDAPFSGHGQSGVGVEHGVEGLLACTQPQVITLKRR
ncbi:aldehyde dehydrogenase [Pseudomonas sp. MWU12-2312b]|uniref:aldehyde dehydrogenase family protein n=1 Tax=Pseudomonas moorei TaxID=395599 RepID=UPI000D462BB0|nr:aldehyde dehydrogenase family protein [Pseudomonas moorei]PPA04501.1 aldehyde dehydrogenase [Pseudomonas sp. MWU12-2312b]